MLFTKPSEEEQYNLEIQTNNKTIKAWSTWKNLQDAQEEYNYWKKGDRYATVHILKKEGELITKLEKFNDS